MLNSITDTKAMKKRELKLVMFLLSIKDKMNELCLFHIIGSKSQILQFTKFITTSVVLPPALFLQKYISLFSIPTNQLL